MQRSDMVRKGVRDCSINWDHLRFLIGTRCVPFLLVLDSYISYIGFPKRHGWSTLRFLPPANSSKNRTLCCILYTHIYSMTCLEVMCPLFNRTISPQLISNLSATLRSLEKLNPRLWNHNFYDYLKFPEPGTASIDGEVCLDPRKGACCRPSGL